jgi:DNA sulfur modification protein DndD
VQLLELKLNNWGPFYGEHVIPLEVDETAPIIVFRGENMRGKTSLLRAIIWSLYAELKEQDGRTRLPVERMVNLDALAEGETEFGVSLKFRHSGTDYVLHRSGVASGDAPERVQVSRLSADLIPTGGHPFPSASIPDVVDGILSREISDFFLFDGEMLNRFEERLREESTTTQGFVREQVERALGLPFMNQLGADLDVIQSALTASMDQVLRKARKHNSLSEKYRAKKDELEGVDRDLAQLRSKDAAIDREIADLEDQMERVDEIKDLYYERKSLEREIAAASDTVEDYKSSLADLAEANWWLPTASLLLNEHRAAEASIDDAEDRDRERFKLQFQIEQLEGHLSTGVCPQCGQAVVHDNEAELRSQLEALVAALSKVPASDVDALRARRDRLRRFVGGPSMIQRVHEQEQDLRRERLRNDKREQRVRRISEQISNNTVDIESLERNLVDRKATKLRISNAIKGLDENRAKLKQEVAILGGQIAEQPEVDETERRLQKSVAEALEVVGKSYDAFRASMKQKVSEATSDLFRRLTTEKEYSGVSISDDYLLKVVDHQGRSLVQISAGANQILTMAFIGALANCSVDEAPMVMDTPFGRLDTGHRNAILEWVSTVNRQVILFVQSGEYDPERDSHLLGTKIGRDYSISRLSPTRSEVQSA